MNRYGQIIFFMIVFALLDLIWLGFITHNFIVSELSPFLTFYQGDLVINLVAAFAAYICLALGPFFFIFPYSNKNTPVRWFAIQGALMGFIIYGVYEFTNKSFIMNWPWTFVLADIAWGTVIYCLTISFTGFWTRSWK